MTGAADLVTALAREFEQLAAAHKDGVLLAGEPAPRAGSRDL